MAGMKKQKCRLHLKVFYLPILLVFTFFVACSSGSLPDAAESEEAMSETAVATPLPAETAVPQGIDILPNFPAPEAEAPAQPPVLLSVAIEEDALPNVNPSTAVSQLERDLVENLFVGLTRLHPAEERVEPALAEGWQVSQNGRVWTFTLRDDIFWVKPARDQGNGLYTAEIIAPVVAEDIVTAVQTACQRGNNTPDVVMLFIIQGCEQVYTLPAATSGDLLSIGVLAPDVRTVQFTLTKPSAYFLTITSLPQLRPIPKFLIDELADSNDGNWFEENNLVTNGMYMPVPNRPAIQKNPLWPTSLTGNVDRVNFIPVQSSEEAIELYDSKLVDWVRLPRDVQESYRNQFPDRVQLITGQTSFYLGFNFNSGVFRELGVREAFSAAIDRDLLVEEVYEGAALPMRHLVPPGVIGSLPVDEVGIGYDPDYARIRLAESGFRTCRLMPPIRYLVNSSDLSLLQAELVRQMWIDELDCTEDQIIIEQVQFGTLLANTRVQAGAGRPDVWELGWATYYPDAHNWLNDLLHCSDSENRSARECSEVDDLLRQAGSEPDFDQRRLLYEQIERAFFSKSGILPIVPLYLPGQYWLLQSWLTADLSGVTGQQFDRFVVDSLTKRLEQSRP